SQAKGPERRGFQFHVVTRHTAIPDRHPRPGTLQNSRNGPLQRKSPLGNGFVRKDRDRISNVGAASQQCRAQGGGHANGPSAYFSLNVTSTALSARKEPARQQRSRTSKYSMSPQTAREPSFAPHPAKPPPVLLAPSDRATASGCRHSSSRQWPQEAC